MLPLPLGDVEATADDIADAAVVLVERGGRPGDRQLLAHLVDEGLLEAGRLVCGCRLLELPAPFFTLLRVDEDLPERLSLDVVLLDVAAACQAASFRFAIRPS